MDSYGHKFSLGDRVVVYQNTERSLPYRFVGMLGTVVGHCSRDVIIRFDDGKEFYIYENDLKPESLYYFL